jgi:ATP-dependent helicase/nuclease subunit A
MNLTREQHVAIHTHYRNLVVSAGAGSGKTFVLVERYLALLDEHPDWPLNALVAITFTRKAAQEMRDRVRQHLEARLREKQGSFEAHRWQERLASMDSARIDTVHGLCATLLRANAAEAGIDPAFDVLDEVDARILLETVIDDLLQSLAMEDDPALALIAEYEAHRVRDALSHLITAEISDTNDDDLFTRWQAQWAHQTEQHIETILQDVISALSWQPAGDWPVEEDLIRSQWITCWDCLDTLGRHNDLETRLQALRELAAIKLVGGSAKVWGGAEQFEETKAMLRIIRQLATDVLQAVGDPPDNSDQRAAQLLPLWAHLIHRAQAAFREAKQQQGALDFDDLESLTRNLLRQHPQVRARYLGAEFKHVLVDEFQDTNAAQWDIVRALADPAQPGCLFVVGDEKQSVYAFRGADVSVFDHVRRAILLAGGSDVALVRSFRTHRPLIDCLNHIFAQVLVRDANSPTRSYEVELGIPMDAARDSAPCESPALELLLLDKSLLDGDSKTERCRRWEAYELAQRLRSIVEDECRPIYDKQTRDVRAAQYSDVALLFQSTTSITLYEEGFKSAHLPFVTVAGRGYYSRQEVWDLLNLLKALHNPTDNLALAAVLRSPMFSLSDDALLALRLSRGDTGERLSLWNALGSPSVVPADEQTLATFARDCLYDLHDMAGRVTISELLRAALIRTGYLATLTGLPDGARRRGNVEKLLDKAQTTGKITLGEFSRYLRDLSAREVREGEARVDSENAVTLMTVHASKGLEFPIVVLVDSSWERRNRKTNVVVNDAQHGLACKTYDADNDEFVESYSYRQARRLSDLREIAEHRRLFYVAATRAQDYLLISGQISQDKNGAHSADGWLGWLWDALNLHDVHLSPGNSNLSYDWGPVSILYPQQPPADSAYTRRGEREQPPVWDSLPVQNGQPLPGDVLPPPLLQELEIEPDAPARHLTATQIADLGSAAFPPDYGQRFLRSIRHDAPWHIEQVETRKAGISRRILGEIVHRALRWGYIPAETDDLESILESYAWELGIVDKGQRAYAVQEARELLRRTMHSDVFQWMSNASQTLHELPFLYKTDKRTIHGVIDVLLKNPDGSWTVIDFKTSHVEGYSGNPELIVEHARRYHLQVGVYAAAVREQLGGITPSVYIHYIRYWQTIQIPDEAWQHALATLEDQIGSLMSEEA